LGFFVQGAKFSLHLKTVIQQNVLRWEAGSKPSRQSDDLACEEPLEIRVDTRPISVTMRTPGHDAELAAGFLLSEGLIGDRGDVAKVAPHPRNREGNVITVYLAPNVAVDFARLTRHVFASSSCGLCGKATIEAVHQQFKPVQTQFAVKAETLLALPAQVRQAQEVFDRTGGLHAAAIFDARGRLLVLREDVGRHNAVDKVLGHGLLQGLLPFDRHILMVSGRASFEIMQKALAARIPVVAAVSAPSSLAVQFAKESRQTLVGFLRGDRMNVYSQPQRVCFSRVEGKVKAATLAVRKKL
jgi:FdhD protein